MIIQCLVSTWGDGAFQLPSGFSVVILARKVNSAGFEILKHPLSSVEYQRLDYLLDTDVPDRHFCYPCGSDKKSAVKYFKYPALDPPKDYQQLQRILVSFIRGVIVAVNEMHDLKLAHLDIRADNVCFRNSEPVLIDLDRSMELNTPAAEIQSLYASSDHSSMYSSFPELKERATASTTSSTRYCSIVLTLSPFSIFYALLPLLNDKTMGEWHQMFGGIWGRKEFLLNLKVCHNCIQNIIRLHYPFSTTNVLCSMFLKFTGHSFKSSS